MNPPNRPDVGEALNGRWYFVSRHGIVTLCASEQDARDAAAEADRDWPHHAPHIPTRLSPPAPGGDAVLVPREPTDEMIFAGMDAHREAVHAMKKLRQARSPITETYRAMLAAAPAPAGDAVVIRQCLSAFLEHGGERGMRHALARYVALAAAPAPAVEREAVVYRLRTPTGKWSWHDGKPPQGTLDLAALHGWPIDYAYTTPPAEAREPVGDAELRQQRDAAEQRAATLSRMLEERTFPSVEVTDAMVERGLRWYWPHDMKYADNQRDFMRRFLEAALTQPRDTPRDSGDAR